VSWTSQGFGRGGEREGGSERARERECERDRMMTHENKEGGGEREKQEERIREFSRDSVGFGRWGANKKQGGVRRERESDRKQAR